MVSEKKKKTSRSAKIQGGGTKTRTKIRQKLEISSVQECDPITKGMLKQVVKVCLSRLPKSHEILQNTSTDVVKDNFKSEKPSEISQENSASETDEGLNSSEDIISGERITLTIFNSRSVDILKLLKTVNIKLNDSMTSDEMKIAAIFAVKDILVRFLRNCQSIQFEHVFVLFAINLLKEITNLWEYIPKKFHCVLTNPLKKILLPVAELSKVIKQNPSEIKGYNSERFLLYSEQLKSIDERVFLDDNNAEPLEAEVASVSVKPLLENIKAVFSTYFPSLYEGFESTIKSSSPEAQDQHNHEALISGSENKNTFAGFENAVEISITDEVRRWVYYLLTVFSTS